MRILFLQIAENKMIPKDDGLKMKKRLHLFSDEDVFRVSADCLKPAFFFLFTSGFRLYMYGSIRVDCLVDIEKFKKFHLSATSLSERFSAGTYGRIARRRNLRLL